MFWYNKGFYKDKPNENAIEISDNDYNTIMEKVGSGGLLTENELKEPIVEETDEQRQNQIIDLRLKREIDCFSIINRGKAWYKTLSAEQEAELDLWYRKWLNVTVTKEVPQKPSWLK